MPSPPGFRRRPSSPANPWSSSPSPNSGRCARTTGQQRYLREAFFDALNVPATVGRRLTASDYADGAERVIVIGTSLWRQQFGGEPSIVGQAITLDGETYSVVGVLPPAAELTATGSYWVPDRISDGQRTNPTPYLNVVGRLKSGVTPAAISLLLVHLKKGRFQGFARDAAA